MRCPRCRVGHVKIHCVEGQLAPFRPLDVPIGEEFAMRDVDLFRLALGLMPPRLVNTYRFDADNKRLDIEIDFKIGGCFARPDYGHSSSNQ